MDTIKYGDFTFPYNGSATSMKASKRFSKHEYPNKNGADLEPLGNEAVEISVEGVFFDTSMDYLTKLYAQYKKNEIQTFSHPMFPDCTKGLMTELSFDVKGGEESYEDEEYPPVHYKFTVIVDREALGAKSSDGIKKLKSTSTSKKTTSKTTYKTYKLTKKMSWAEVVKKVKKKTKASITKAKLKSWNKGVKSLKKGTKIKYQYK